MSKKRLLVFLMIISYVVADARTNIIVKNQQEFDELSKNIVSAIKQGDKDIFVIIIPGIEYVAKDHHIHLAHINAPSINLNIVGNGSVIIPKGNNYQNGDDYDDVFSYNNSWMFNSFDVPLWTYYSYAQGLVEVVDSKTCRIKTDYQFARNLDIENAYILIPEWCQTDIYKVNRMDDKYVYFNVDNIRKSYNGGYLVNDDYNYGNKKIRYKLCNIGAQDVLNIQNKRITLPEGVEFVREGQINNYITLQSSTFNSVTICGLELRGNSYSNSTPAVFICDTNSNGIWIKNCVFRGLRGTAISIETTANVTITDNLFYDCHYYGVCSDNGSKNTVIDNNTFELMGKRMQCSFCISCKGEGYYVARNVLKNFGYGGIGVGVWHGHTKDYPSSGVVEYNELFFTENYLKDINDRCIMDGGAIYVWTNNDKAIIQNNFIHDFSGIKDNRGIFCDDGAKNFVIKNNIIINIHNSYCIDSRRVSQYEQKIGHTNVNNVITNNIVDGEIRFNGREMADNGCVLGTVYYLNKSTAKKPRFNISNVFENGRIEMIDYIVRDNGCLYIKKKSFKRIARNPELKKMMMFFNIKST